MPETTDELDLARAGDAAAFERLVAPHRRELRAHCYRMSGSLHDAEDLLQDTLVKAWKGLPTFQGRASVRTWLYTVATNACLDLGERRRVMPTELGGPSRPGTELAPSLETPWLEPCPAEWIEPDDRSPEARYSRRQSVTLAFLTALQRLPAKQRAVLLLRDVLGWQANECGELLDLSVAAVNSALQRARDTLGAGPFEAPGEPDEQTRSLLQRYLQAWERADLTSLVQVLREDAVLSMPPLPGWFRGAHDIAAAIGGMVLPPGSAGRFRLVPISANAQAGFAMFAGSEPVSVHVLTIEGGRVARIDAFLDARLVARF
jgi:RNA polymerase sigma-70 factor (ECF subfamily)